MARPKKVTAAPKARKTTPKKKQAAKGRTGTIKMLSAKPSTRRPPNNPDVPQEAIDELNVELNEIKTMLDDYSAHLRSLDRMRLNGVGVRKLGFVERAYELALENGEFLPHYLTLQRFGDDIQYYIDFRSLVDLTDQIREKLWNITMQSADICPKAFGFWARSLRYAQTPHINSWSFAKGKTPKLSGVAG